jgi:hypothetical protein
MVSMKFRVTMKDPDTLNDAIEEAVEKQMCGRWFGYGEYLTVEIDTDAKTCTVIPDNESIEGGK